MTREEAIKWLSNLKKDIGKTQHQELWHYEQAIDEVIKTLQQEPSKDCIDRYSALAELHPLSYEYKAIKELPSVVPSRAESKRGEWVERESYAEDKEDGFETTIVCSCCDFPATIFNFEDGESRTQVRTDFCPNCGCAMKGGEEE